MIDTVRVIYQPDGAGETDPVTLKPIKPEPVPLYEGKGKVKRQRTQPGEVKEGGASTYISRAEIGIPIDAPEIPPGAWVTWLTSVRDPSGPGRKFLVMEVPGSTLAIQRVLVCEEADVVQQVRP